VTGRQLKKETKEKATVKQINSIYIYEQWLRFCFYRILKENLFKLMNVIYC
jgi:hypothetical protein